LVVGGGRGYEDREYVFCENIIPEVITENDWDFPFAKGKGVGGIRHPDAKMIRSKKWKLNFYVGEGGELYDLENDPDEDHNLYHSTEHKEIVEDLKEKILEWMISSDETEQIAEKWLF
jgi:arylsulfatase A-like enzyme